MLERDKQLVDIRQIVINSTDECFDVCFESDGGGNHFTLYLVKNSIDITKLRRDIREKGIKRRVVVVLSDEKHIKSRHQTKEVN